MRYHPPSGSKAGLAVAMLQGIGWLLKKAFQLSKKVIQNYWKKTRTLKQGID